MNARIVAYDIASPKRLRRVARVMQEYGVRVQKSVFECMLTEPAEHDMVRAVEKIIVKEEDQIRILPGAGKNAHECDAAGLRRRSLPKEAVVA